jgi:hypothetical protein
MLAGHSIHVWNNRPLLIFPISASQYAPFKVTVSLCIAENG